MRKLAERWLAFAHKDLVVARQLVDQPDVFDMAAFHCQQAVEKSLKGLLVLFDLDIPKIHDLSRLYTINTRKSRLEWDIEALDAVNEFYIETRYPLHEDHDPLTISRHQLDRMIRLAESAIADLRSRIDGVVPYEDESDEPDP
jgi:HEPN domain-containing protein